MGREVGRLRGGSGSASLTFTHAVVEPNYSIPGIAVLADSLELNGGSIKSASDDGGADLSHTGLGHDPEHRVNWRLSSAEVPWVVKAAVSSSPASGDTYGLDETIRVRLTFNPDGERDRNSPIEDRHGPGGMGREVGRLRERRRAARA